MERIKKNDDGMTSLLPQAEGWGIWRGGRREHLVATLGEAAALLPPRIPVHLALPTQGLIIERLRLPATERAELAGMVRLQWEKTLPFPPEEVSGDFAIITQEATESTVLAVAVPHAALDQLCQPLRDRSIAATRLSPFLGHVAAACPAGQTVLAVYVELGQLVIAMIENRRAGWVHLLSSWDATRFSSELPQLLLAASMDGVPATFTQVLLAPEAAACEPALRQYSGAQVGPLPAIAPAEVAAMDLVPPSWRAQTEQRRHWQQMRHRLGVAAVVYLLVAAGGFAHLFFLRRESARLQTELAALRPKLEQIQARDKALGPLVALVLAQTTSIPVVAFEIENDAGKHGFGCLLNLASHAMSGLFVPGNPATAAAAEAALRTYSQHYPLSSVSVTRTLMSAQA